MQHDDDHQAEGLAADLPHLTRRRVLVTGLALGGAALTLLAARGGAQTVTGTGADGSICVALPEETAGPFPADGTNVRDGQIVNILTEQGVIREDIRNSIGGLTPVAEGVPVVLEITLVDVRNACAPLAAHAVYLWQCDAAGVYSIYGAADRNYLRGVAISDSAGRVRFTTVFPGCYPGRWPHLHFEVFGSPAAAVDGTSALLTSQFAFPDAACADVYRTDPRYSASAKPFGAVSLRRDGVFRGSSDSELAAQVLTMSGDPAAGYRAHSVVGLLV